MTADGYSCDYAWSPDGEALVFASLTTDNRWQLRIVDLATFRVRTVAKLAYGDSGPDPEPAWTPTPAIVVGGDTLSRLDPTKNSLQLLVSLVSK